MNYLKIKDFEKAWPVPFYLIRKIDLSLADKGQEIRRAKSRFHQTPHLLVGSFYKPIARLNLTDAQKK